MKILFVCKGNIGRSQMAEAFFASMSKHNSASSAGTNSREDGVEGSRLGSGRWNTPDAMREIGLDVSDKASKQLTPRMVEEADKVIVIMIAEESTRLLPEYVRRSGKVEQWEIEDAKNNKELTFAVRDTIKKRVEKLVLQIG
ncbi:MAG: low molecular weight phosphatase family protein [Candidatus Micrarchaeota archaeon]|nr:low molecular weight phosphatase family protein [Candidatus Micrarchaeota archaeon]MDE1847904.1 low molecular weight phosphatase family protein [Candidatus Micrarchaeota archaeon]MDE1864530.1 low molecular weight phosphatase family protein [Candidatus Micrarchaeota archaeon]